MKHIANKTVQRLKQYVKRLNNKLAADKLFVHETTTNHCVITLVNAKDHHVIATLALNARSKRDLGIAKAFLSLVKNVRNNQVRTLEASA